MKSLTVDTNTLYDHRNVNFNLSFSYAKVERKFIRLKKKNSTFPDNLGDELDDKFSITQNDCQHTDFYPCVICVTINFKRLRRDVYEKCCPSIEKYILIKGECNKWYNIEIKIARRNTRHAENKYRQDKANEN